MKNRTNIMAACSSRVDDLSRSNTTVSNLGGTVRTGIVIMSRLAKIGRQKDEINENVLGYIQDFSSLHDLYSTEALIPKDANVSTNVDAVSVIAKQVVNALDKKSKTVIESDKIVRNIQSRLRKQLSCMTQETFGDYDDTISDIISFDDFMKLVNDAGKYRRSIMKVIQNGVGYGKLYKPFDFRKSLSDVKLIEATKLSSGWDVKKFSKALESLNLELSRGFESTVHLASDIKVGGKSLKDTLTSMRVKNSVLDRVCEYHRDHTVALIKLVSMLETISL